MKNMNVHTTYATVSDLVNMFLKANTLPNNLMNRYFFQ